MLKIDGGLSDNDNDLIKRYTQFALAKLIIPSDFKKSNITIKIIDPKKIKDKKERKDFNECGATMLYEGTFNGKKKFSIDINHTSINSRAKKQLFKYKHLLIWLGHELVHVSQYVNNEVFEYTDGRVRFDGKIYALKNADDMSDEDYWFAPWERAAYGLQLGLYSLFCVHEKKRKKALENV